MLAVLSGQELTGGIPYWPAVGAFDFDLWVDVGDEFYVGEVGNWSLEHLCYWFIAADETGPGGSPWTCVNPTIGPPYPAGWVEASAIPEWGNTKAYGIGVYYAETSGVSEMPLEEALHTRTTWGAVKSLFR